MRSSDKDDRDGVSNSSKRPRAGLHIHKWQEATCTEPETCAVCGKTRGGPKGHAFTLWDKETIGLNSRKELEYRECRRCGAVEWRNIKAELSAADAEVMGKWDSVALVKDGKVYELKSGHIIFISDNSGIMYNDKNNASLFTWEYSTGFSSDKKLFYILKDNKKEAYIGHAVIIKDRAEKEIYGQLFVNIIKGAQVFYKKREQKST